MTSQVTSQVTSQGHGVLNGGSDRRTCEAPATPGFGGSFSKAKLPRPEGASGGIHVNIEFCYGLPCPESNLSWNLGS